MPSAVTRSPRLWARLTIERTIVSDSGRSIIVSTNARSIFSVWPGKSCSTVSDE